MKTRLNRIYYTLHILNMVFQSIIYHVQRNKIVNCFLFLIFGSHSIVVRTYYCWAWGTQWGARDCICANHKRGSAHPTVLLLQPRQLIVLVRLLEKPSNPSTNFKQKESKWVCGIYVRIWKKFIVPFSSIS